MHRISIVPRGGALGYTLNLPEEDRYLKTRDELIDYMTVLLGGRVAERMVFGAITTGASDDLRRSHEISRAMVHEYGMGTELTSRQVAAEGDSVSDATRRMLDEEQQYLDRRGLPRAPSALVRAHRDMLEQLAEHAARPTRCSSATRSTASWRRTRAWSAPRGSACASRPPVRTGARRVDCAPCWGASTTSGSRSRTSRTRCRSTATLWACRSCIARWWRSRASRRCCWTSARATSSCCAPLGPDTPVGRFLAQRGPGLHHVAYQVADVSATLEALRAAGLRLIDEEPRVGIRDSRVAFVHPRSTGGVLTEIVQPAEGAH